MGPSMSPAPEIVVLDLTRRGALKRFVAHLLIRLLIVMPLPGNLQAAAALFPVSLLWPLVSAGSEQAGGGEAPPAVENGTQDTWGNFRFPDELQASTNRFAFTGYQWDQETSLYNAKARLYDPEIGRFITQDS